MHDGASLLSDARHPFAPLVTPHHTLAETCASTGFGEDGRTNAFIG
jgi:hypothetical protein